MIFFASSLLFGLTGFTLSVAASDSLDGIMLAQADSSSSSPSNLNPRRYGLTRQKENLWRIAKLYRPVSSTISQTMLAIFDNNSHAFYEQNINRLKINVMLDIPDDSVIAAVEHREAYQEVIRQIAEYEEFLASSQVDDVADEPQATVPEIEPVVSAPVATVEVSEIGETEIETIKQELEQEEQQIKLAETAIIPEPEPKKPVKKRKPRKKPERPLFRYSYEISTAFDDNIRRAQNNDDIREDVVTNATLKARGGIPIDSFHCSIMASRQVTISLLISTV